MGAVWKDKMIFARALAALLVTSTPRCIPQYGAATLVRATEMALPELCRARIG
jgi:hypothetical protein